MERRTNIKEKSLAFLTKTIYYFDRHINRQARIAIPNKKP